MKLSMEPISEYQQFLMMAKITDSLKWDEEQEFERMMLESVEFRSHFEQLRLRFQDQDTTGNFARIKEPGQWRDLTAEIKSRQHQKTARRLRLLAAAVLIGVAIGGWWLLKTPEATIPVGIAAARPPAGIMLRLNDGKLIDLSNTKGAISTSSGVLNNENKTLTYSNSAAGISGANKLIVPVGMDYKMVLGDGTKVWLNAATEIDFPFSFTGASREITINGEAYLEVAKDANKPFVVRLPRSSVYVLGTEFNVNSYDKQNVSVALVSGAVKMKGAEKEVPVNKGMQATLNSNGDIVQQTFDVSRTLSWREGLFYFKHSNLEEISSVLPRWYGIDVVIDNKHILSRKFSGVVDKNQPIQIFMSDIKKISGIDSYLDKDKVLHFR